MRYHEIIKESEDAGLIQRTIYLFVSKHLTTDETTRMLIRNELRGTATFWVSAFDELNRAIETQDYDQIEDALQETIDEVAHQMKEWAEDPMNFAPGNNVGSVSLEGIDALTYSDLAPVITAIAPGVKKDSGTQQAVTVSQEIIPQIAALATPAWDWFAKWVNQFDGIDIADFIPAELARRGKSYLNTVTGPELRQDFTSVAADFEEITNDHLEAMHNYVMSDTFKGDKQATNSLLSQAFKALGNDDDFTRKLLNAIESNTH